ncbi:hypothetical protein DL95DRAFT_291269 [Leptodontidium sp. 2 PMI_412]|nr:hypothetical protein DL95DRAFT_291269 [Leptodontidium sp. 2 PMI_412]
MPSTSPGIANPTNISPGLTRFWSAPPIYTLSPPPRRTSPPTGNPPVYRPAQDLWAKALPLLSDPHRAEIDKIKASMGQQQKSFKDQIEHMVVLTKEKQVECEKETYKFTFLEREIVLKDVAERVVSWLVKFKDFGDIAVSFDPVHAALPWAGVRLLLQVATAGMEQMGALLVCTEMITYLTNRCTIYESLYKPGAIEQPALDNLNDRLVELYAAILRLIAVANHLFPKNTVIRGWKALWKPTEVSDLIKKCQDLEPKVDFEVSNCERARSQAADAATLLLLNDLQKPIVRIDENVSHILEKLTEIEQLQMLEWISPLKPAVIHSAITKTRTKNTCEWLLRHGHYECWRKESTSTILWLYGTVGTGKTYLASRVIDDVTPRGSSSPGALAFFYCNRSDPERREQLSVLRSFVKQLSTTVKAPLETYYRNTRFNSEPTEKDCEGLLLQLVEERPETTFVLDALDECHEDSRDGLITSLINISSKAKRPTKIFISSRPDNDIKQKLQDKTNVAIRAEDNEDDISTFVRSEIGKSQNLKGLDQEIQNEIVNKLQETSQGMFQWTKLQMKQISKLKEPKEIQKRLGELPPDLPATYKVIFDEMGEREKEVAERAFKWAMCSCTLLSTKELLLAVSQEDPNGEVQPVDGLTEELVLQYCHYLLIIDSNQVWVPSHISVLEYVEDQKVYDRKEANCLVAIVCLSLLTDPRVYARKDEFMIKKSKSEWKETGEERGTEEVRHFRDLAFYARHHWMMHVQNCEEEENQGRLPGLLARFLGSPEESSRAYKAWFSMVMKDRYKPGSSFVASPRFDVTDIEPSSMTTFTICAFGFSNVLSHWDDNEWTDVNIRNANGYSQLQLAAISGSVPLCKHLIARGANVNEHLQGGGYGSVLAAAAAWGNMEVVKSLIGHRADVNLQLRLGWYGSALAAAAYWGKIDIVQYLVDKAKSDANLPLLTGEYGSALTAASAFGDNKDVVQFLLHAGAIINKKCIVGRYGSAIAAAEIKGNTEIKKMLETYASLEA